MYERQPAEELSGTVALGLLAEEMVLVTGRLIRGEKLRDRDLRTLESATALLRRVGDVRSPLIEDNTPAQIAPSGGYLDAIRALQAQAAGANVDDYARRLADLLDKAGAGEELTTDERAVLAALRATFAGVGDAALMRANDLSHPTPHTHGWLVSQAVA